MPFRCAARSSACRGSVLFRCAPKGFLLALWGIDSAPRLHRGRSRRSAFAGRADLSRLHGGLPMTCPTKRQDRRGSKSAGKKPRLRSPGPSRANPPDIFVRVGDSHWPRVTDFKHAHLRNRKGYVYLSWRDGEKVRTFYLGKAPRKSPTLEEPGEAGAGDVAAAPARARCRRKLRGSR